VLTTFLVFIIIDWALSRKKVIEEETEQPATADLGPNYVEGFLVPDKLQYHPGHSWAFRERKRLTRVGVDEFAAALIGRIERIEVPKPGTWIRQGQKVFSFYRDGEKVEVLSPTEAKWWKSTPNCLKILNFCEKTRMERAGCWWCMFQTRTP